jgi:hypothetical protein
MYPTAHEKGRAIEGGRGGTSFGGYRGGQDCHRRHFVADFNTAAAAAKTS